MKKIITNRLIVPFSVIAFLSLCLTRDLRWNIFLGLCFVCFIVSLFFSKYRFSKNLFKNKAAVVFGFILSTTAFISFYYQMTEEAGFPRRIAAAYKINIDILAAVIGFVAMAFSMVSTILFAKWIIIKVTPVFQIIKKRKREFIILVAIYCFSLIAVFRANFYYIDDIGRATQGYQLTGSFGRYISTFLSNLLHSSTWLTDISPLTQIIAALIMALSGVLLLSVFSKEEKANKWAVIALIPMGLSPYFLSCLSYKYDAPYMAVSVLFSIVPLLYRKKKHYKYMIAVFVGTLLMCMTYQASSGVFPMIVVMVSLYMWMEKDELKKILFFYIYSIVGYASGLLFFKIALVTKVVESQGYVDTGYSLLSTMKNLVDYTATFLSDFGAFWLSFVIVIAVFFMISIYNNTKRVSAIILALCVIIVTYCLSFGAYIIMKQPLFAPRAMYGIGVWISLLSIPIMCSEKVYIGKSSVLVVSWFFIVFSFTYGNALSVQQEYADFRTEQIIEDIKDLDFLNAEHEVTVQIDGNIGHAKNIENMIKKYPILERGVPVMLKGDYNYWGHFKLINYYDLNNLRWNSGDNHIDLKEMDLSVVVDNAYHTIKADENHMEIILKNHE